MFGSDAEQVVGLPVDVLLPSTREEKPPIPLQLLAIKGKHSRGSCEHQSQMPGGRAYQLSAQPFALRRHDNREYTFYR
jgi:hypothetical protein